METHENMVESRALASWVGLAGLWLCVLGVGTVAGVHLAAGETFMAGRDAVFATASAVGVIALMRTVR